LIKKTGKFKFITYLPETKPSVEEFKNWVFQSLNQVAFNFSSSLQKDIILCNQMNSIYFTTSDFVYGLLKLRGRDYKQRGKSNSLDYVFNFGVPVLENIKLNDILRVRNDYGETFESFREELEKRTSELRYLKDDELIKTKINDINYDFKEGYIEDIKKDIVKFGKGFLRNSTVITGSLAWNLITSDMNYFATFLALQQGYATYREYLKSLLYNPSYFLWKVNKNSIFDRN